MPIVLDRRIVLLLIALGCAYVVSPALAGVLAVLIFLDVRRGPAAATFAVSCDLG